MLTPKLGTWKMSITLFLIEDRVVIARVEKDFIDVLFGFLNPPPFWIHCRSLSGGNSSLKCIDYLHQVVKRFRSDDLFCKRRSSAKRFGSYLLNPAIALHQTSRNELLKIGRQPFSIYVMECRSCDITGVNIFCTDSGHTHVKLETINPT